MKAIQLCVTATVLPSFSLSLLSSVAFIMICCLSTLDTFRARWRGDFKIMSFLIFITSSCSHAWPHFGDFKLVVFVTQTLKNVIIKYLFMACECDTHPRWWIVVVIALRLALNYALLLSSDKPMPSNSSMFVVRYITSFNKYFSMDVVVVVGSFIHFQRFFLSFQLLVLNLFCLMELYCEVTSGYGILDSF